MKPLLETHLRGESPVLEEPEQVRVLSVDVAAYLDGGAQFEQHRLAHEHLPGLRAQLRRVLRRDVDGGAGLLVPGRQQQFDHPVHPALAVAAAVGRRGPGARGLGGPHTVLSAQSRM